MDRPTILVQHVRDYLVDEGVCRRADTAAVPVPDDEIEVPPIYAEPKRGVPAPGSGTGTELARDVVVGCFHVSGPATRRHEGFMRISGVRFRLRARRSEDADGVYAWIRSVLNDRIGFDLSGLTCHEAREVVGLQAAGADQHGYDYIFEFMFWYWQDPPQRYPSSS
jgi:hypothetical protein